MSTRYSVETLNKRNAMQRQSNEILASAAAGTIFNYLSENALKIKSDKVALRTFELLTVESLGNCNSPQLRQILKTYGWTGKSFNESFLLEDCLQALANYWLCEQHGSAKSSIYATAATPRLNQSQTVSELIMSFVPDLVLNHINAHLSSQSSDGTTCSTFYGAVLLADVSGLSKIANNIYGRGVRGLNDLRVVSGFVEHFLETVHNFGGDLISIGGSSIICVFPDNNLHLPINPSTSARYSVDLSTQKTPLLDPYFSNSCAVRALHCGSYLCSHPQHDLSIKAAVSCGQMTITVSGGHDNVQDWAYFVNGDCFVSLASCMQDAGPKELVTTKACFDSAQYFLQEKSQPKSVLPPIRTESACSDSSDLLGDCNITFSDLEVSDSKSSFQSPIHCREMKDTKLVGLDSMNMSADDKDNKTDVDMSPARASQSKETSPLPSMECKDCTSQSGNVRVIMEHTMLACQQLELDRVSHLINTLPAEVANVAKLFVPAPVLAGVCAASLDKKPELRRITTLCLALDVYGPAYTQDPMLLAPFLQIVLQLVHESGGYLKQVTVDNVGCYVMVMWGVPSFSYTSNCPRSVYCAAAIVHKCATKNLKCSAGISEGPAYCSVIGCLSRDDYFIVSPEIDLARQLMLKARGRVLIDYAAYLSLPKDIQVSMEESEVLVLPDYVHSRVQSYAYQETKLPHSKMFTLFREFRQTKTVLLREHVRIALNSQLDRISNMPMTIAQLNKENSARSWSRKIGNNVNENSSRSVGGNGGNGPQLVWGRSAVFTIVLGKPGTGKSTAAEYFIQSAQRRNLQCYHVQCRAGEEVVAFKLLRNLFIQIVGVDNFATETQQRELLTKIIRRISSQHHWEEYEETQALIVLQNVLGLVWTQVATFGNKKVPALPVNPDDPERCVRLADNDKTFYDTLCVLIKNNRTVIVIEDAHYCDELSWHQLYQILQGDRLPAAVLITTRTPITQKRNGEHANGEGTTQSADDMSFHLARAIFTSRNSNSGSQEFSSSSSSKASFMSSHYTQSDAGSEATEGLFGQYGHKFFQNASFMAMVVNEHCQVIEMSILNDHEVREILHQEIGSDSQLTEGFIISVMGLTEGNAYWCKVVGQYIKEKGMEAYNKAIIRPGSKHGSLNVLIQSQMEHLSEVEQLIARYASIIGDEFSVEILVAILPPESKQAVSTVLAMMQDNHMITCMDEKELIYSFHNRLIRRTLYDMTHESDSMSIHLDIAQFIENKYKTNITGFFAILSYHYRLCQGNRYCALKYTVKAGNQAIQRGAFAEGFVFLQAALPLAITRPELRALRLLITQAIREINPYGFAGFLKKIATFSQQEHTTAKTQLRADYSQLMDDLDKTLKFMSKEKALIEEDGQGGEEGSSKSAKLTPENIATRPMSSKEKRHSMKKSKRLQQQQQQQGQPHHAGDAASANHKSLPVADQGTGPGQGPSQAEDGCTPHSTTCVVQ